MICINIILHTNCADNQEQSTSFQTKKVKKTTINDINNERFFVQQQISDMQEKTDSKNLQKKIDYHFLLRDLYEEFQNLKIEIKNKIDQENNE